MRSIKKFYRDIYSFQLDGDTIEEKIIVMQQILTFYTEIWEVVGFISGLIHPTDPDFAPVLNVLAFSQYGTNQVQFIYLDQ